MQARDARLLDELSAEIHRRRPGLGLLSRPRVIGLVAHGDHERLADLLVGPKEEEMGRLIAAAGCATMGRLADAMSISCTEYHELRDGMTVSDVQEAIGFRGEEVTASRYGRVLRWSPEGTWEWIQATFDSDGRLQSKSQAGVC